MIAKRLLTFGALVFALCLLLLVAAAQKSLQTETVLHNFGGFSGDGAFPYGGLLYHKGTLYGTTAENAPDGGSGTVFQINSRGRDYKTLYNFCSLPGCPDGGEPLDLAPGLVLRDGKFYGTTLLGGETSPNGIIFGLTLDGTEDILYRFDSQAEPEAGVTFDEEGNLFTTTYSGGEGRCPQNGIYIGCGAVFELTAAGEQKLLHSFGTYPGDGQFPATGLIRILLQECWDVLLGTRSADKWVFALGRDWFGSRDEALAGKLPQIHGRVGAPGTPCFGTSLKLTSIR